MLGKLRASIYVVLTEPSPVSGSVWKYLYHAVDKAGKTVDYLLTAKRDIAAAKRFIDKAMDANGKSDKIAMDKSGANKAAFDAINAKRDVPIVVRQVKYLNNIVEPFRAQPATRSADKPPPNPNSGHTLPNCLLEFTIPHAGSPISPSRAPVPRRTH